MKKTARTKTEGVAGRVRRGLIRSRNDEYDKSGASGKSDPTGDSKAAESLPMLTKKTRRSSYSMANDEGDGLTEKERCYLQAVSQGKLALVEEYLRGQVDCHIKNSFGRFESNVLCFIVN